MAAAAHPAAVPADAPRGERWLFGPLPDLVLGCGLGYSVLFVLQALHGDAMRAVFPIGFAPLAALVTGIPHYGATLLRVYDRREDRRAYVFFTVHLTLLLAGLFGLALWWPLVGSVLVTLYLTWSPWHYAGQNYGLSVMFLRRRRVAIDDVTKRLLYASFFLSFVLTFLAVHTADYRGGSYAPETARATPGTSVGPIFEFLPLGIPGPVAATLLLGFFGLYLTVLGAAALRLLRRATPSDLLPTAMLVGTQALWFSIPVAAQHFGLFAGVDPLAAENSRYAFLWVIVGHSVQYLWVTAYYASRTPSFHGRGRWYAVCLLAGSALWGLPALVFGPALFGSMEYMGGLVLLVAAVVNLHHFLLDGAIWKLRDGRVAQILIRPRTAPGTAGTDTAPRRSWLRPAIYAAGALCAAISVIWTLETEYGWARASQRKDVARMRQAAERLDWIGRGNSQLHLELALFAAEQGRLEEALREVEASLALRSLPRAWYLRGLIYERRGDAARARESFEQAYALTPGRSEVREALERVKAAGPS